MMDFATFVRIAEALEREGVSYVVVGSMAMAAQGIVRATRDLNLFVASDPTNVERLKRALRATFQDRGECSCASVVPEHRCPWARSAIRPSSPSESFQNYALFFADF